MVAGVVDAHIAACRKLRGLENAWAIVIPESNMPHMAMALQDALENDYRTPKCVFMMEDSSSTAHGARRYDLPGSITTHRNKLESVDLLRDQFLKPERCLFHAQFVVAQQELSMLEDVQAEIVAQLRNFKKVRLARRDRAQADINEVTYTGKKTGGKNDDFVSTALISVYNRRLFWQDPRGVYRAYHGLGEQ